MARIIASSCQASRFYNDRGRSTHTWTRPIIFFGNDTALSSASKGKESRVGQTSKSSSGRDTIHKSKQTDSGTNGTLSGRTVGTAACTSDLDTRAATSGESRHAEDGSPKLRRKPEIQTPVQLLGVTEVLLLLFGLLATCHGKGHVWIWYFVSYSFIWSENLGLFCGSPACGSSEEKKARTNRSEAMDFTGIAARADVEDDVWGGDDDELGHYTQTAADLEREWEARRNHFHTLGYRDGISAGKESEAQAGFNSGFKEAVVAGYNWGVARGIASAFAALTPALKELISKDQDAVKRLENLNSSISCISSDNAMRIYYEESILRKGTTVPEEGLQNAGALETNSSGVTPPSQTEPDACCGGTGDCNMQRLSLEPATADKPHRSGETRDAGPCSNSSLSSVVSLSTDEETVSEVDDGRSSIPHSASPDVETSNGISFSEPCTQLELLRGEVEKELKSVVKLSGCP